MIDINVKSTLKTIQDSKTNNNFKILEQYASIFFKKDDWDIIRDISPNKFDKKFLNYLKNGNYESQIHKKLFNAQLFSYINLYYVVRLPDNDLGSKLSSFDESILNFIDRNIKNLTTKNEFFLDDNLLYFNSIASLKTDKLPQKKSRLLKIFTIILIITVTTKNIIHAEKI